MCSAMEVSAILCHDSISCHFLVDRDAVGGGGGHSYQPRRKTDREQAGLAREGGAGCTIQALWGENNGAFIEKGGERLAGWRGQFGAHSVPWPAQGTGHGMWDGTVWY